MDEAQRKPALGPSLDLFLISFLTLFLEMALIRWLPAQVRALSYFVNIVLISSFLGIGSGCLLARRRIEGKYLFAPLLLIVILLAFALGNVIIEQRGQDHEHLWLLYSDLSPASKKIGLGPVVALFYLVNALLFIPLGQVMGRKMSLFKPLSAYSLNILGSLAGIGAFCLFSFLSLPSWSWFALSGLLIMRFMGGKRGLLWLNLCLLILSAALVAHRDKEILWSPYYSLRFIEDKRQPFTSFDLLVNGSLHQVTLSLKKEEAMKSPIIEKLRQEFVNPYNYSPKAEAMLVLGAGTGNDVSIALQKGAERVEAVEIDPVIARLGKKYHPDNPYGNGKVKLIIDDGRSYLKKTQEKYDLILFGTLDSQTLLSGMANLRLDNYMYTLECFEEAKAHLTEDGVLALFFMVAKPWIGFKLYLMLKETFGQPPIILIREPGGIALFNLVLVAGPDLPEHEREASERLARDLFGPDKVDLATDDWPYLYLKERQVPSFYLKVLGWLVASSALLIFLCLPRGGRGKINPFFFLLGGGFLLLETKSITEMSLLFGSTWVVNAIVVASILLMILLANLLVSRLKKPREGLFLALLLATLLVNYFLPLESLLGQFLLLKLALSCIVVGLPLFFAGLLFATAFQGVEEIEGAFGSNLLGAVLGGVMEYVSLSTGLKTLYFLALLLYLLALTTRALKGRARG